ncbi:MAG: metallophosphoesterase [Acidobacteria bacterium]|nr:metallophosphoesterase [Acidobacteriota bacterium]
MGKRLNRIYGKSTALAKTGLLVALSAVLLLPSAMGATASARLLAVGDIHGDFDALVAILQESGIIDHQHHWRGGNATLVQTGDILDRGPKDRQVMDLLMALEKEASKSGGRVIVLLGNHEVMNLMGDLRYVAPETYFSFADDKSEKRRQDAYQDYVKLLKRRAQTLEEPTPFTSESERQWMQAHPPGFIEFRKALEPKGKYGRWLRERPAIVQIADTIFLHGGIHPNLASLKVTELNQRIKAEIQAFDTYTEYMVKEKLILPFFDLNEITSAAQAVIEQQEDRARETDRSEPEQVTILKEFLTYGSWLSIHPDGPLWFRGFAQWSPEEGAQHLPLLLKAYGAKHFVVGHTPQLPGHIQARFEEKIFLIDSGMLSSYYKGGRASALEIQDGKFTPLYLGEPLTPDN